MNDKNQKPTTETSSLESAWVWLNVSWLFWAALELVCVLIRAATMGS